MSKLFWVVFSLASVGAGSLGFCWGHGLFSKSSQDVPKFGEGDDTPPRPPDSPDPS